MYIEDYASLWDNLGTPKCTETVIFSLIIIAIWYVIARKSPAAVAIREQLNLDDTYCMFYQKHIYAFIAKIIFIVCICCIIYLFYVESELQSMINDYHVYNNHSWELEQKFERVYKQGYNILCYLYFFFPLTSITLAWDAFMDKVFRSRL